jgi:methionine synthase I (cobalamin-dependent)
MIETNTFSANRISQADYGCEHLVRESTCRRPPRARVL